MKRSVWGYALAGLVLFSCGSLPVLGSDGDKHQAAYSATDVEESIRRAVSFEENRNQVSVALPDGTHRVVAAGLDRVTYKGRMVRPAATSTFNTQGLWHAYELVSKDKDVSYNWCIWSGHILGRFGLFITPDGDSYLTWVETTTLCLAEVSKPVDQQEKTKRLNDYLNSTKVAGVQYIDVGGIVGQEKIVDTKASPHYANICLTSVEKDENGGFTLRLHGNDPSTTYVLITDKEAEAGWRLEK